MQIDFYKNNNSNIVFECWKVFEGSHNRMEEFIQIFSLCVTLINFVALMLIFHVCKNDCVNAFYLILMIELMLFDVLPSNSARFSNVNIITR